MVTRDFASITSTCVGEFIAVFLYLCEYGLKIDLAAVGVALLMRLVNYLRVAAKQRLSPLPCNINSF